MAWISIQNELSLLPIIFYFGAIFWTLGYDTIYGYQDIYDDEIIGVKSTSIKFKNNPKKFISFCYLIFFISLIIIGFLMKFREFYYISLIFTFYKLYSQSFSLKINNTKDCLIKFRSNNFLGLVVFLNLILGKLS